MEDGLDVFENHFQEIILGYNSVYSCTYTKAEAICSHSRFDNP